MKITESSRSISGSIEFNDTMFSYNISRESGDEEGCILRLYKKDSDSYRNVIHTSRYHITENDAMDALKEHFGRMDSLTKHTPDQPINSQEG